MDHRSSVIAPDSLVVPDGILLVDKPEGCTSFDVIRRLRRMARFRKIGHAGTLDPFATGLLIVLSGKATKHQSMFLEADKAYEGIIRLGVTTDTDDMTGQVLSTAEQLPNGQNLPLDQIIQKFTGEIEQRPPQFSAIRIQGERSYDRARRGEAVEIPSRIVRIHELSLSPVSDSEPDQLQLAFQVKCSKGTYIRSLARDIGEFLGCGGALLTLRRTWSTPYSVSDAVSLERLEKDGLKRYIVTP